MFMYLCYMEKSYKYALHTYNWMRMLSPYPHIQHTYTYTHILIMYLDKNKRIKNNGILNKSTKSREQRKKIKKIK